MRRILAFVIPGLVLASALPAQPPAAGNLEDTLVKQEKQSWEAWKSRDGNYFQGFLSDDHVEMGFAGPTDKKTVVSMVGSPVCKVNSYIVDHFKMTQLAPDTALLTYRAEQDTTCNGRPVPSPVWVSSLFVKHGDRWLNALYQQTPAAAPPAK